MRIKKDKHWFWICTRRVDGVKCNRGKKSLRDGTIFDGAMLSTQTIVTIRTVKWYKFALTVCTEWINDPSNSPKMRWLLEDC